MFPGTCTSFGRTGLVSISVKFPLLFFLSMFSPKCGHGAISSSDHHMSVLLFSEHIWLQQNWAEITGSTHIFPVPRKIQYPPPEGCICYHWWSYIHTSLSHKALLYIRVHSKSPQVVRCMASVPMTGQCWPSDLLLYLSGLVFGWGRGSLIL